MSNRNKVDWHIPQRNIDLVNGFVREIATLSSVIPRDINDLCLCFVNLTEDNFDVTTITNEINHNGNIVICNEVAYRKRVNVYLTNTADKGNHIWRFRLIFPDDPLFRIFSKAAIGVFKTKYKMEPSGGFNWNKHENDINTGYEFMHNGEVTNPDPTDVHPKVSWNFAMNDNDIMTMKLNMNKLTLCLEINDVEVEKIQQLEDTEYRAVVSIDCTEDGWELLSYQHIY